MSVEHTDPAAASDDAASRFELAVWFGHSDARGWWLLVSAVGVIGGLVSAGYVEMLRLLTRTIGPDHFSKGVDVAVLAGAGLVIALLVKVLGDPGNVEMLFDNVHVGGKPSDLRALRTLIPVSLIGIAAGSAIGPEAPLVQTTGTIGSWIAERLNMRTTDSRVLAITGMASAFAVLFGAPLGAALFALEILHRRGLEYYEALLPAAFGALSGWVVFVGVTRAGFVPVWTFPTMTSLAYVDFLIGIGAGVAAAVIAVAFTYSVKALRQGFNRLPTLSRPVIGGAALGVLALISTYSLTFGETQIQTVATVKLSVSTLIVAAICKFVATTVVVSAGWRGGFIIPLFFIGAAIGASASHLAPHHEIVLVCALMAAVNVGVTKTPFGSTVVIAEMSGLRLLPPVLLASIVCLLLTSRVSLIETQRART
ncbi:MAG: chloride channel protein [Ilumatobacteraceae bacterium]